jgi:hypothetical protein
LKTWRPGTGSRPNKFGTVKGGPRQPLTLDLTRTNAIPFALVRPHASVLEILQAQSAAEIYAPTQAAVDRVLKDIP